MKINFKKFTNADIILRIWIGAAMISHSMFKLFNPEVMSRFILGVEKLGFPIPFIFGYLAKGSEFFGGILLILGLFTRPAAFFIVCTMFVATFLSHDGLIFTDAEQAFTYLVIAVYFVFKGSDFLSLDKYLFSKEK